MTTNDFGFERGVDPTIDTLELKLGREIEIGGPRVKELPLIDRFAGAVSDRFGLERGMNWALDGIIGFIPDRAIDFVDDYSRTEPRPGMLRDVRRKLFRIGITHSQVAHLDDAGPYNDDLWEDATLDPFADPPSRFLHAVGYYRWRGEPVYNQLGEVVYDGSTTDREPSSIRSGVGRLYEIVAERLRGSKDEQVNTEMDQDMAVAYSVRPGPRDWRYNLGMVQDTAAAAIDSRPARIAAGAVLMSGAIGLGALYLSRDASVEVDPVAGASTTQPQEEAAATVETDDFDGFELQPDPSFGSLEGIAPADSVGFSTIAQPGDNRWETAEAAFEARTGTQATEEQINYILDNELGRSGVEIGDRLTVSHAVVDEAAELNRPVAGPVFLSTLAA